MKLYTYFSKSHRILYNEHFLPSVPTDDNIQVQATEISQIGDGDYMSQGWRATMQQKVKIILRAIQRDPFFVWSDCDVQFFGPFVKSLMSELGDHELACQHDSGGMLCAGFFVCRATDNTRRLFQTIYEEMESDTSETDDQHRLNRHADLCRVTLLSPKFWTVGVQLNEPGRPLANWNGQELEVPADILMHHANWTIGVANKIRLLNSVRSKVMQSRAGLGTTVPRR